MLRINDILDKAAAYLPPADLEMIEKAYVFSATVHQGQVRLSGEPYLTHPMEVAGILVDMKTVSYTHLRAHETVLDLVCRLLLEKKKTNNIIRLHRHLTKTKDTH